MPSLSERNRPIEIWQAELAAWQAYQADCWQWLAADERRRAAASAPPIRDRFVLTRGLLRWLLSRHRGCDPAALAFRYGDRGKPYLIDSPWHFNLAHSGEWALYVIALRPVGIDVERERPLAVAKLARRFFTPTEAAAIAQLPAAQQQAAFFATWTRKEAYLKATGTGLSGLQQVEVSVMPNQPACLRAIADHPDAAQGWTLTSWQPAPHYWAALAIAPGPSVPELHHFTLTP
ncbi:MAG: 4'-phosphopantetheinyl transferase superfamily protein [Spirulinaceae cyanobacterium SM2_1_0]|nr:4'-phosphopantetheinyl transferase superfamily protein [Spirulinaceae cyanobacterium SM2_1_0]